VQFEQNGVSEMFVNLTARRTLSVETMYYKTKCQNPY